MSSQRNLSDTVILNELEIQKDDIQKDQPEKSESLKESFLSLRMVVYLLFYVFLTPRIVSFQNWIYPWLKWSFREDF